MDCQPALAERELARDPRSGRRCAGAFELHAPRRGAARAADRDRGGQFRERGPRLAGRAGDAGSEVLEEVRADLGAAWYEKAAALGSANAQFNLGRLLETGQGVPRSLERAVQLYREASVQGVAQADVALARLMAAGAIELADRAERERVLRSAASASR